MSGAAMGRIMVVDDDPYVLESIAAQLDAFGYTVSAFADGNQAFSKFIEKPADVVLTDINMPVVTGMELLEKIRTVDQETPLLRTGELADALKLVTSMSREIIERLTAAAELRDEDTGLPEHFDPRVLHAFVGAAPLLEAIFADYQD